MLGRVMRDAQRKNEGMELPAKTRIYFDKLLAVAQPIHSQQLVCKEGDPSKIYNVDAPELGCIAKGKVHK